MIDRSYEVLAALIPDNMVTGPEAKKVVAVQQPD